MGDREFRSSSGTRSGVRSRTFIRDIKSREPCLSGTPFFFVSVCSKGARDSSKDRNIVVQWVQRSRHVGVLGLQTTPRFGLLAL